MWYVITGHGWPVLLNVDDRAFTAGLLPKYDHQSGGGARADLLCGQA
jgi:hypothetical protein